MPQRLLTLLLTCLFFLPAYTQTDTTAQQKDKKNKKVTLAGVPIVNYNLAQGMMFGAMGTLYYKLNKEDSISPSSSTMGMGMYTTSKSYFLLGMQKLYFREDNWRSTVVLGTGTNYFQFYQGLPGGGYGYFDADGVWIDFSTDMRFVYLNIQRQIYPELYFGLVGVSFNAKTTFDLPIPVDVTTDALMNKLGYMFLYDNRNNLNYPSKGFFISFDNLFIRDWMGSTQNFNSYEFTFNHFWDIQQNEKSILVSRFYTNIAAGDVPFQGQSVIGRDDLRGYTKGEYRNNQVYAVQAELRQKIYKKFSMVGFFGLGAAVEHMSDLPHTEILPGGGLGLRYLMIPKEKINVGIDVGVGKNDWSLAFRIGETFGR